MPQATHAHTTFRRAVFALAGSTLLTGAAFAAPAIAPAGHPDAALLALCAEFCDLEARHRALPLDKNPNTPEGAAEEALGDALMERQSEIVDALLDLPATTLEGHRAVASALTAWADPEDYHRGDYMAPRLVGALLLGLVGRPIHADGEPGRA